MTKCLHRTNLWSLVAVVASVFIAIFPLAKKALALSITVSIPEKYTEVSVGEKLYFETSVKWPENNGRKDLRIEYSIVDEKGKEVAYLKVLRAIETQASFMDSVTISESTQPGTYRINAKFTDYGDMSQEVSTSFKVVRGELKSQVYIYIIIVLLFVIALFVMNLLYSRAALRKQLTMKASVVERKVI